MTRCHYTFKKINHVAPNQKKPTPQKPKTVLVDQANMFSLGKHNSIGLTALKPGAISGFVPKKIKTCFSIVQTLIKNCRCFDSA